MKHRLKGLLALVLSLTMLLSMVVTVSATGASVEVGGVEMLENYTLPTYYVNGATAAATTEPSNWNAKLWYNEGVLTLTLKGADISVSSDFAISIRYTSLTISLEGTDNTIESTTDADGIGIYVFDSILTISGTSPVDISGSKYGINAVSGGSSVVISGGTVKAEATGDAADSSAIYAVGDITINGGTVNASGKGYGIYGGRTVTIESGTVNAGSNNGSGIYAYDKVTITGGEVKSIGVTYGIYAENSSRDSGGVVVISGGKVEAKATATDGSSVGIYANNSGAITIGDSEGNPEVTVGCLTGLDASTVNILDSCTVDIDADDNAIKTDSLFFGTPWYKWKIGNGPVNTSSEDNGLTNQEAATSERLLIAANIPTGGTGPVTPQPPVVITPTPVVEKTEAPNTFDSGIALSVAMTILAATGSAVLAKKRED